MNDRTQFTQAQENIPVAQKSRTANPYLTGYLELFEMDGHAPDVAEQILDAMQAHRPNGYGVFSGKQLARITKSSAGVFMPACYALERDNYIDRLIINPDHIIFAVTRRLSKEVIAIQNRRDDEWLASYDGAQIYSDSREFEGVGS